MRLLLRKGTIHTPKVARSTAMAVDDDTVTWVGDEAGADHFVDNADAVVDLCGSLVTPAFVDAHVHLAQTGLAARGVDLRGAASREEALDRIAGHATRSSDPVVLGYGWDETQWSPPEPFTGADVDRAVHDRPAYLARIDVHSAIVSTALLDRAPQLTTQQGWAGRGRVERDAHHAARAAADALVTSAMRQAAIRHGLRAAATAGIGLVHELGAPHLSQPADFARIDEISRAEPVPQVFRYWGELGGYDLAAAYGCLGLAGDLCVDGALGSRTAALEQPYTDALTSGHLYLDAVRIRDHLIGCTRRGLQAGFHVIGDRAVATVLSGLRAAAEQLGPAAVTAARHRLEHVEMIGSDELSVLADLGVVASVQPAFDATWGGSDGLYARRLGVERSSAMNPLAAMSRAGVTLAFGADSPVTPMDPWAGVRAAVWHRSPSQRIDVRAAISAHTRGGWRAGKRDDAGWLAAGLPASYAVWRFSPDQEHTDVPDLRPEVPLPSCLATVVDGVTIYSDQGAHP
ncbi:MAG: amidohydrolase family protein [Nocardioidaceae bacterium]|nr:amidohydrolase family protein [Nocardioidaceae bacterium]